MNSIILNFKQLFHSLPPFFIFCFSIFFILALFFFFFMAGKAYGSAKSEKTFFKKMQNHRNDAVKRSRAVLSGQMAEQLAPYLPEFPCTPADAHFLGKPVDFIAFTGCAQGKELQEVLFIEVKTGNSKLSEREKELKKAIEEGRCRYVVYKVPLSSEENYSENCSLRE